MANARPATGKLVVFISYSRHDMAFADELVAGLELLGEFEVRIDRHAIHEGENWKARLRTLIAEADTVVFILSPKSAASPICKWEVEESGRQSKIRVRRNNLTFNSDSLSCSTKHAPSDHLGWSYSGHGPKDSSARFPLAQVVLP